MKNIIFLITITAFLLTNCSPKVVQKTDIFGEYMQLQKKNNPEDLVGKKVTFVATRCSYEEQHMMKTTMAVEKYICIESDEVGQILAYYMPETPVSNADNLRFRVFGTVGKISGVGKGGGVHTEYFIDLDNVEM